jgi:hypothetical protein
MGYFTDCLETGETDYADRAFLVHHSDGERVLCGLLESVDRHSAPSGKKYEKKGGKKKKGSEGKKKKLSKKGKRIVLR